MTHLNLNGSWRLFVMTHSDYRKIENSWGSFSQLPLESGIAIEAQVPGNYELDLEKAEKIDGLFYGKNLLKSREMEWNHLFYSKKFCVKIKTEKRYRLCFRGIDTIADVYLNGVKIRHVDNMLIEYEVEVSQDVLHEGENELFVHISPTVLESRKYEYPLALGALKYEMDSLYIRKSPYMYGWDIFPRILSGGIWRDVYFEEIPQEEFLQSYLFVKDLETDYSKCTLEYFCEIELGNDKYEDYEVLIEGNCGASRFEARSDVWSKAMHMTFQVEAPMLWWPRRNGQPNLYQVTASLLKNGVICAEKNFRFGIRTVELVKTSITDENGSGDFCFWVNHKKIFILGTNWVPLDSFPSQGKKKILSALEMTEDLQCNMIRCWGGGYYEEQLFYDLCDEKGILVWQDFMQACGIYPQDDGFLMRFEEEVTHQVRRLRQHACLALWAGDNENDMSWVLNTDYRLNPNHNRNTREIIPQVLRLNDYTRDYLPSSPYMDETAYRHKTDEVIPEQHLWGPRDYYKGDFYKKAVAHFASETGYHGCPSPESIERFISPDAGWPYKNNEEWLLHASSPAVKEDEPFAYRIELMAGQIETLFGEIPDNLNDFALLSQISQAEAKKYFIERFRIGKWRRTGIIWWNLLDGCPQFSDAVVDYYFVKKIAYWYIKRAQEKVVLAMDEPREGRISLMGINDFPEAKEVCFTIREMVSGEEIWRGTGVLPPDSSTVLAVLNLQEKYGFYLIEWDMDGMKYRNHYVSWQTPMDWKEYVRCARQAVLLDNEK